MQFNFLNNSGFLVISFLLCFPNTAILANDDLIVGELFCEHATLHSIGFECRVSGDENNNANCKVLYREANTTDWKEYLPFYRVGKGVTVGNCFNPMGDNYIIANAFVGSIMNLKPATAYDVRIEFSDIDGISGAEFKEIAISTRSEIVVPSTGIIRHVYPPGWTGAKNTPSYENIMHAVNGYPPLCDVYRLKHPDAAKPGTIIKVYPGVHTYDNNLYWANAQPQYSYWLHGMITFVASGEPDKPIYIVAEGEGEVIFDGDSCDVLFNIRSSDYLHFEGIRIRNTRVAFHGGYAGERGGGCKGLTIKGCKIDSVDCAVIAQDGRSDNFTIIDNIITGSNSSKNIGNGTTSNAGIGLSIAGQGHTISKNQITNFWEGVSVFGGSLANPANNQQSRSIDISNNRISNCTNRSISTNGGYANICVFQNYCINTLYAPFSTNPVYAGPVYFIKNVAWNVNGGSKMFDESGSTQALIFMHNTSSTNMGMPLNELNSLQPAQASWHVINNLSVGSSKAKSLLEIPAGESNNSHVVDYNAYNMHNDSITCFVGKNTYSSLADLIDKTGYETNSKLVSGFQTFVDASEPEHAPVEGQVLDFKSVNLKLKNGSEAIDGGVVIKGINDDYSGLAPDIGAYEEGGADPVFGPVNNRFIEGIFSLNITSLNGVVSKWPLRNLYPKNEKVTLTPKPLAGYKFSNWTGDVNGNSNPLIISMDTNKTIAAEFSVLPTYRLKLTAENGSIIKVPSKLLYYEGDTVKLTATPQNGYFFNNWGGDVTGSQNPISFVIDSDKTIIANFKSTTDIDVIDEAQFLVYPNPSGNGSLNVEFSFSCSTIEIYDLSGRIIRQIHAPGRRVTFEPESFEKGIYLVRANGNFGFICKVVVVL